MSSRKPSRNPTRSHGSDQTPAPGVDPASGNQGSFYVDRSPAQKKAAVPAQPPAGSVLDRRSGIDRRDLQAALGKLSEDDNDTGLERRRGPGRRRSDFTKSAEEGEMNPEQFLFVMAIDAFKRSNGKMFPTWTDVLEVIRLLGYRKTMSSQLKLPAAEDWLERPDAPANVRTRPGHAEPDEGFPPTRRAA